MTKTSVLDWTHDVVEVGSKRDVERAATEDERRDVARALKLVEVSELIAVYRLDAPSGGRVRMTGHVRGELVQSCVVSLDPVSASVSEDIEVEFDPNGGGSHDPEEEIDILGGADVEPLVDGRIEAGRVVFETFAAALDPYPRKSDVSFEWEDPAGAEAQSTSPFAALRKLSPGS